MRKSRTRNRYLKYIVIGLAVAFLITAALMIIEIWENRRGRFPESDLESGVVAYEGQDYVLKDNIETFLVLGLDKYEGTDSQNNGNQADFLMLFVFDDNTQQCTAIQINRDTMANVNRLDVGGNKIDTTVEQIALAYNYIYADSAKKSSRNVADSVEDLLMGIPVQHYITLTMDSVAVMNDLVGGVEVTVLDDFTGIDDTLVEGETVTLKGEQALRYVRTRYGLEDSTNSTRMERQQQYINALYDKTMSCIAEDDEFVITLVDTMDDYATYDISDFRLKELAEKFDEYEFLGIRDIEGETQLGDEFIEFYPDEASIWEIVIDLFYTPKVE